MFRPEKMYRAVAVIPKSKVNAALLSLQERGICQIKESETSLNSAPQIENEQKLQNLFSRLEYLREKLSCYEKKKSAGLMEFFSSKKPVVTERKPLSQDDLFLKVEECLEIIEESVKSHAKEIEDIKEKQSLNNYYISNLEYLPDANLSLFLDWESKNLVKTAGIATTNKIAKIRQLTKRKSVLAVNPIDKKSSLVIAVFSTKDKDFIESVLHEAGFEELRLPGHLRELSTNEAVRKLKEEYLALVHDENKVEKELHKIYISYYGLLNYFYGELEILKQRVDANSLMKSSDSFSVLEAWVPARNIRQYRAVLEKSCNGYYIEYGERDDAPALLNNPKLIAPFEKITEMYSLPKYGEFDPTPIVALTFSLFFGFVMADFFYGLLVMALGLLLMRGKGSYDKKTRNMSMLITSLGISTILFGIIFGSYFGNFFQQLGANVPYLVDPMSQVMIVLLIALATGVAHISTGLFVGFFENVRKGKFLDGLQAQGIWILFVSSIICFLLKVNMAGIILICSSVILQIGLNFRASGFAPALLSVFSFAGFVGDVGSYARLMALCVSSGGIALAFNLMVMMAAGIPFIGWPFAIVIFAVGHIFNILMAALGGFVHPLRLHFLEHFSKYYDGGGKKYSPFGKTNG